MRELDPTEGDAQSAPPKEICLICGKLLSTYNKTGRCFHHADPKKKKQQVELTQAEKLRQVLSEARETETPNESTEREANGPSREKIIEIVGILFGFSRDELKKHGRRKELAHVRQILMYLLYNDTSLSYPDIGTVLGGRDHSTIIYGVEKVAAELEADSELRTLLNHIRSRY